MGRERERHIETNKLRKRERKTVKLSIKRHSKIQIFQNQFLCSANAISLKIKTFIQKMV